MKILKKIANILEKLSNISAITFTISTISFAPVAILDMLGAFRNLSDNAVQSFGIFVIFTVLSSACAYPLLGAVASKLTDIVNNAMIRDEGEKLLAARLSRDDFKRMYEADRRRLEMIEERTFYVRSLREQARKARDYDQVILYDAETLKPYGTFQAEIADEVVDNFTTALPGIKFVATPTLAFCLNDETFKAIQEQNHEEYNRTTIEMRAIEYAITINSATLPLTETAANPNPDIEELNKAISADPDSTGLLMQTQ